MPLIIIRPKDVMTLHDVSYDTARRRINRVRAQLGKSERTPVTIAEYCQVNQLAEAEVRAALGC